MGELSAGNGTVTGEVVKEQLKVLGLQTSVTNYIHKN
jgi:hypothetical protein